MFGPDHCSHKFTCLLNTKEKENLRENFTNFDDIG